MEMGPIGRKKKYRKPGDSINIERDAPVVPRSDKIYSWVMRDKMIFTSYKPTYQIYFLDDEIGINIATNWMMESGYTADMKDDVKNYVEGHRNGKGLIILGGNMKVKH